MSYDFDVVIAGGGPAGSSTANFLRQRNRSVLVLEREKFPRFHIGESMLPFSNELWRELGVFEKMDARYIHKPGAKFIHEESGAEFTYYFENAIRGGHPYAYQVKRADFDKMLLDHAASLGAEVREETKVGDVVFAPDGVTVSATGPDGKSYQVRAPMFVDATGRDALIAGRRQLKVPDGVVTTNVAVHTMYQNVDRSQGADEGNIILGLFDGGWWWMIPFKDGDTSVGMVFEKSYTRAQRGLSSQELMEHAIEGLPNLKRYLKDATRILEVGAQGNWSYRSTRFYDERLLMVGDAAAFVDPLFSTGVLFAAYGARFAAGHIDAALTDGDFSAERFAPYQDECARGMDLFKGLVHEFYAQNLRKILLASSQNPTICAVITSLLAGDVYKPAMWQSMITKAGFSNVADVGAMPTARSSRQVRLEKPLA
ncbi:MAG: putative Dehyrogenase [Myxococcales bacterium]|nr:putative Dehyrogenase [Myxococcales bacterium]